MPTDWHHIGSCKIACGDCRDVMASMAAQSVDSIVTDPPYGLLFMGKGWDHGIPGVEFWQAALRVAKPGAHLLAFGGTRTFHRLTCAIEDAGWEIRDCLMWCYGSGFPKSLNIGNGWGTALKPAWEPVIVARKPIEGTVAANVQRYGTGGINIDGCRVGTDDVSSSAIRKPGTQRFNGDNHRPHHDGDAVPTVHGSTCGRFPSNLIHDGSDSVLAGFPQTHVNKPGKKCPGVGEVYDGGWGERTPFGYDTDGSAARFFYCAKASRAERGIGNNHPTVKPQALMRYLVKLVTPPGGIVLDPFCGSGSTGLAIADGQHFIGIEQNPEYVEIIKRRWNKKPAKKSKQKMLIA